MSRNKRQLLATKKQMLIKRIEQQRSDLAASSKDWLQTTERYDRTWKFLLPSALCLLPQQEYCQSTH